MCNRFRSNLGWRDWTEDFSDTRIPLRFPVPLPNLLPEVRPTDPHAILRPIDPADPMAGLEAKVRHRSHEADRRRASPASAVAVSWRELLQPRPQRLDLLRRGLLRSEFLHRTPCIERPLVGAAISHNGRCDLKTQEREGS